MRNGVTGRAARAVPMASASYVFHPWSALAIETQEELREIPGLQVWRNGRRVVAPYTIAWAVEEYLHGRSIGFRLDAPLVEMVKPGEVEARIEASELHAGIWTDFCYPFQRECAHAAIAAINHWVVAPAGSGKTLIAEVWALAEPGPVVAVVKAGARRQWTAELERFADVAAFPLLPEADYRKRDRWHGLDEYLRWCSDEGARPVIVMGWEGLHFHLDQIMELRPASVVFDESHRGRQRKRAKYEITVAEDGSEDWSEERLDNLSERARRLATAAPRRLLTTATPIINRLVDVWAQASLIELDGWGKTARRFEFRYCNAREGDFQGQVVYEPPGISNTDELQRRLSFHMIRIPYAVLKAVLPPKRRIITRIPIEAQTRGEPMTREDRAEYRREMRELGQAARSGRATHWVKERLTELFRLDAAERKRGWVRERIPEVLTIGKGKVILFTGRKRACDALATTVRGACRGVQVWAAHGDVPEAEREEIRLAFMEHPGPCVLVGTYQAWGESLNLQDADYMGVLMLPITPGEIEQIEGRGARLGQERPLLVEYARAEHTIDDRLATILLEKLPAVETLSGGDSGVAGLADSLKGIDDLEGLLDRIVSDLSWLDDEE